MTETFFAAARQRYIDSNAQTLAWMLKRPALHGAYLNTKLNPLTLVDYSAADGWRGPDHIYGWIQGRGLESVATHAAAFADIDSGLSADLDAAGRRLYAVLDPLRAKNGHAYFCYDREMNPIRFEGADYVPQTQPADIYAYSDSFTAKGLVAAAARYAPADLPRHLDGLAKVIAAIEDGRFQIDEKLPLGREALDAQPDDFGIRMIMLSAAALLTRIGRRDLTDFAPRFISHVIDHHFDPGTGLLRNVPGEDACNVGHGIEFVGFALDYLEKDADPELLRVLETILVSSFDKGFNGPGVRLVVSAASGAPISPYCPWWPLPETIRSAALCHERSGSAESLRVWQKADEVFFRDYWREGTGIAYQCLTEDGPVDYVPATPDLDPGYHTGLSLLAAIDMVDRRAPSSVRE
jgi:mannose/cellobiose epimerase-like protein (N-acyl-D-glucosamine 2-epimerase family)